MPEMSFVIDPPSRVAVPVAGAESSFPVRRIYCVGRNYTEHVREMGGDVRHPPFFFQKPTDAIVLDGAEVPYPLATSDFHHEVELVLAIGEGGEELSVDEAGNHVFGIAVGIDLTRRDAQLEARTAGRPWEIGKAFDKAAPIGVLHRIEAGDLSASREIRLTVNGVVRQQSNVSLMIWSPAEIISRLSCQYRLEPGDLIYTGTPEGVGPLLPGDLVEATLDGLTPLRIAIVDR